MNDIDLSSYSNWDPIGDNTAGFTGVLDGNGYTISNLTINRPDEDYVGLFAIIGDPNTMTGGEVRNLGIDAVDILGNNASGLAVGSFGTITNCYVTGDVTGNESAGGLVVQNMGIITNSYATGNVTGCGMGAGGLVGNNAQGGSISNSYASGIVIGYGAYIGGLVGMNYSANISNSFAFSEVTGNGDGSGVLVGYHVLGSISNCYAVGKVTGNGDGTGGLLGYNVAGTISNSYALSEVIGNGDYVGGLVGHNGNGTISNTYVSGFVQGSTNIGGMVGVNLDNAKIENSVWDTEVTRQNSICGSDDGTGNFTNNKGLTTAEMQNPTNWSGWDSNIWDFSSYPPTLKNMPKSSSSSNPDNPNTPGGGDVPIPGAVRLQIGSDSSSTSAIYVDTSFDLGAFDVDFSSADSCAAAIEDIDEVLSRINTKRSEFGAVINRLSSILESQTTTIQNFTSAKSTIMDADIANESADFVKNQILQQTSSALLAQSQNLHASIVLSLIG